MSTSANEGPYVLTGVDAQEWYMGRRGGGHLLDAHLGAITQRFGPDVGYTLRAPIDPVVGRPTFLIIEIDMPASDERAWETLNAVEGDLLDQRQLLSERARRKDPFANILIVLRTRSRDWTTIQAEIERME